ncbi:MAG: MFS transporter, partial [Thermoanaerobaculia bacterium]|nr:MFS transporter [Thermoanaerobaculia bacterium]
LRSRLFVTATLGFTLAMVAQVGALTHYFKLVSERAGPSVATLAVSVVAGSSILGRLTGGWFLHRLPLRSFSMAMLTGQGLALCGMAVGEQAGTLLFASALFGATMGNILMLQSLLLAEAYGATEYPQVFAKSNLLAVAGIAGGPLLLGVLYEQTGGYTVAFFVAAASSALAVMTMRLMPMPERN